MTASCPRCAGLDRVVEIRTPGEFEKTLRVIRANLADGTLEELAPIGQDSGAPLIDLSQAGPWPDCIDRRCGCTTCGSCYRLTVETWHGAGGRWARVACEDARG